jgi:hypothetical protein
MPKIVTISSTDLWNADHTWRFTVDGDKITHITQTHDRTAAIVNCDFSDVCGHFELLFKLLGKMEFTKIQGMPLHTFLTIIYNMTVAPTTVYRLHRCNCESGCTHTPTDYDTHPIKLLVDLLRLAGHQNYHGYWCYPETFYLDLQPLTIDLELKDWCGAEEVSDALPAGSGYILTYLEV